MRQYEVALIIHPELDDAGLATLVEKVQGWITDAGGSVTKVDSWGKKRLAYDIRKQREGYYVLFQTDMSAGTPPELERNLRLNEQVLRFMIVRMEEVVGAAEAESAEQTA